MARSDALQEFVDAAFAAFARFATDPRSQRSIGQIFQLLETQCPERVEPGSRLAICHMLEQALDQQVVKDGLSDLVESFKRIEPRLRWDTKVQLDKSASANFSDSHANGMIFGPGGIEEREDLWLGVTLMAPHVRYPDHNHPPEETYLVLSPGEFSQNGGDWFTPGVGGSFYNTPAIKHAMRSLDDPFFAFWALLRA